MNHIIANYIIKKICFIMLKKSLLIVTKALQVEHSKLFKQ